MVYGEFAFYSGEVVRLFGRVVSYGKYISVN